MEQKLNDLIIIIQGRTLSSRLPKKILLPIYREKCIIDILLERFSNIKYNIPICLATTNNEHDDELFNKYKINSNILCFRGSENNVLLRYYEAAIKFKAECVVRVNADCPLIDPDIVGDIIEYYHLNYNEID